MSTALNDRDAILQAASVRVINPKNASILLAASTSLFHLNAAGDVDVPAITITATLIGLEGDVTFTVDGAALTSVTGKTAVVRYEDMQGPTAIVTARILAGGQTFSQSCIIGVVRDGSSGGSASVLVLTPSQHVFKINKDGTNSPASITLTAAGQNLGGTPSFTIPVGTATLSAGANSLQKILTFANMATDVVTIQVEQGGVSDRVTIVKLREGVDGVNALTGFLSNESHTVPATSDGSLTSVAGATTYMQVFQGITEDTSNWEFSASPASNGSTGLAYEWLNFNTVHITGMAAGVDAASLSITASKAGMPTITKQFSISKSRAGAQGQSVTGARGAGQYYAGGSVWSDGTANAVTPGDNVVSDVVTISNGGTFAMTKRWDGAAWNAIGAVFDGSLFVTGSINGAAIKAGTLDIRAPDGKLLLGAGGEFNATVKVSNLQVGGDQDNLVRDSRFKDLAWWGFQPGANVSSTDWAEQAITTGWRSGASLHMGTTNGVPTDTRSAAITVVPGATYLVEYQIEMTPDFEGELSIAWLLPGVQYYFYEQPAVTNWGDNNFPIQHWTASPRELRTITKKFTVPADSRLSTSYLVMRRSIRAGRADIGGFSITRVADGSLVGDGVLEARHIVGDTLDVLAAKLGDIELGPNGALRQGAGYNAGTGIYLGAPGGVPRFFAGTAGGANIRWSPEEGLVVDKAQFSGPGFETFSVYFSGFNSGGSGKRINLGTRTALITGGVAPFTYSWTFVPNEDSAGSINIVNRASETATFSSSVGQTPATVSGTVSVVVIDAKGRSASITVNATCNHL
jgi:hypothetical protein